MIELTPDQGLAQKRSLGQLSCWSEQAGAPVRCPWQKGHEHVTLHCNS